jgi:hypothetical protein
LRADPVWSDRRKDYQDAYLVEAVALRRHSGSPALVYIPPEDPRFREIPDDIGASAYYLLGLVRGYFTRAKQNEGMVAAVPVSKLSDVLSHVAGG